MKKTLILLMILVLIIQPILAIDNSLTREIPTTVSPGQKFPITYSTTASGKWGVSIIDSVSGGCKFSNNLNQIKLIMLSTEGNSKTIYVNAPSSGSCIFSGNYEFGTNPIKNFEEKTVSINSNNNPSPPSSNQKNEFLTIFLVLLGLIILIFILKRILKGGKK